MDFLEWIKVLSNQQFKNESAFIILRNANLVKSHVQAHVQARVQAFKFDPSKILNILIPT